MTAAVGLLCGGRDDPCAKHLAAVGLLCGGRDDPCAKHLEPCHHECMSTRPQASSAPIEHSLRGAESTPSPKDANEPKYKTRHVNSRNNHTPNLNT